MYRLHFSFVFFFFFLSLVVYSQDNKIIDRSFFSSPTAASLGEFGNVEVKKSTGGIYQQIPLFQVKNGDITYSPTVEYFSNGFKVDDWGGRLGMGWSENFGGLIQREINSVPDEFATSRPNVALSQFTDLTSSNLKFLKELVLAQENKSGKDIESDIFHFNFFGSSGSFIIKEGKCIQLSNQENYKIELLSTHPYSFVITDRKGFSYYFAIKQEIEYTAFSIENQCDNNGEISADVPTAWFLSKVSSPKGRELVFNYAAVEYTYMYDFNQSYSYRKTQPVDYPGTAPYGFFNSTICFREKTTKTLLLNSINSDAWRLDLQYSNRRDLYNDKLLRAVTLYSNSSTDIIERYEFEYDQITSTKSFETLLDNTLPNSFDKLGLKTRYFLKTLKNVGKGGKYSFSYNTPEELPHRFSFMQDLAGYYNGKWSAGLIPQTALSYQFTEVRQLIEVGDRSPASVAEIGLLNKITYPTGGYTNISYEQNSYSTKEVLQNTITIDEDFVNNSSGQERTVNSSIFVPSKSESVNIRLSSDYYSESEYPYDNDGSFNWVRCELWNVTTNNKVSLLSSAGFSDTFIQMKLFEDKVVSAYLEAGHQYWLSTILYGPYTSLNFSCTYNGASTSGDVEKPFFGMRVKQISNYPDQGEPLNKVYTYNTFNESDDRLVYENKKSSVIAEDLSKFVLKGYSEMLSTDLKLGSGNASSGGPIPAVVLVDYWKISSRNQNNIYAFSGQPIIYSHITEVQNSTAFTAHENWVMKNSLGTHVFGYEVLPVGLSNDGVMNGSQIKEYVGSISDGKNLIKAAVFTGYSKFQMYPAVSNYSVKSLHEDYPSINETLEEQYMPYAVSYRPLFFETYKLSSTDKVTYLNGTKISVSSQNYYDSPSHKEPTRIYSELGNGVSRYIYQLFADDYPNGTAFIDKMKAINRHMVAFPIEKVETTVRSGAVKVMRAELIRYKNDGRGLIEQIDNIKFPTVPANSGIAIADFKFSNRIKGADPVNGTATVFSPDINYENVAKTLVYDYQGNPLEIKLLDRPITTYLWGYNGEYPIAEIKNAAYSDVLTKLGGQTVLNQLNSSSVTEAFIAQKMEALRTALPAAHITSFTYQPLVGMRSKTDPRGVTEYYEYDGMQRLKAVLDQFKNVTSALDYHYRPN